MIIREVPSLAPCVFAMRLDMTCRIVYEDLESLLHLGRPFETETWINNRESPTCSLASMTEKY
jgi:hypothetical protein